MEIGTKTFEDGIRYNDNFGMVIMGAGGDHNEWVEGIEGILKEHEIVSKEFATFSEAYVLSDNVNGSEGRCDLVVIFSEDAQPVIGKLALWRLSFGDISWIDDFCDNYSGDYVSGNVEEVA